MHSFGSELKRSFKGEVAGPAGSKDLCFRARGASGL